MRDCVIKREVNPVGLSSCSATFQFRRCSKQRFHHAVNDHIGLEADAPS